jgi:DNA repair exonuclease SbcCD ATPase subunit
MNKKIAPLLTVFALFISVTSNASYKKTTKKSVAKPVSTRRAPVKKVAPKRVVTKRSPSIPVRPVVTKQTSSGNITVLTNELQRTQRELQNARAEVDQLRVASAVCETAATLPEEVTRLTQEKAQLVAQIEQQELDLKEIMEQKLSNNELLSAAQQELAQKDRDIADGLSAKQDRSDLEDQIMRQAMELAAKEEQLALLNAQIASLLSQIRSLQDENQQRAVDLQQQISDLERRNQAITLTKKSMEQKLQRAQGDLETLAEQHTISEQAIKETVAKQLETKYRNQIAQLEQQNVALTARNQELVNRPSTGPSQTDFDQLKQNLATEKEAVKRLDQEIRDKNKEIEAAQKETREAKLSCEEEIRKLKQAQS